MIVKEEKEIVYSSCGEVFNDSFACYDNGDVYWSGEKRALLPSELIGEWVGDALFDGMLERLYDEVGDVADSFDIEESDMKHILDSIKDIVDASISVNCFAVDNIKQHVMGDGEVDLS